jgi:hypothetical protein
MKTDTALKRFRVECIQHYVDESYTNTEVLYVSAYDNEHAEDRAWEIMGGERGEVSNMTFRSTRAK